MTTLEAFAPAKLGPATLRNRIIKSATFEGMTPKGVVTDELIDFHRKFAAGGVGMTTVAYCAVAPEGRTSAGQLQWTEETAPGLRRLTDAIHAEGAAVSAQIGHAGAVANPKSNGHKAITSSRHFHLTTLSFAEAASEADIDRIVEAHAHAARAATEAGFDAIELHFGHGYLISSFLSPKLNHRNDSYGGSLKNRARFARRTARAVRDAVGTKIAVIAKVSMDDGVPGGFWLAEAITVVRWLEEDGTLDGVVLTAGSSLENPLYTFRGDAPLREFGALMPQPQKLGIKLVGKHFLRTYPYTDAYLLDHARQIRDAVDLPLVLLGGITGKESIDLAMREGFEFVQMGRALLSDPNLIKTIEEEGHGQTLCIHCNKCITTIYGGTRCVLRP
ncbi:NADH:flavin oxidoreductase [Rhodococcus globerulus]|uniref:NADH:flavin oxidoreductase n=1 Tax=Rhodococcus globerulus TaxID=33008 RepID=UPI001C562D12|nr:NADH:flavin oxidoreductase [Rhodococcus globerulus]QXW01124.1 NADH:flavin oxidoreductase [Rhodococcus globerulus]